MAGMPLAPGYTLEWRIVFRGGLLSKIPSPVGQDVMLLPVPRADEQLEVVVIIGPSEARDAPRGQKIATEVLAEGCLSDGRRVWLIFGIGLAGQMNDIDITSSVAHTDPAFYTTRAEEMRGMACGVQEDGSLAFWDTRVERRQPDML